MSAAMSLSSVLDAAERAGKRNLRTEEIRAAFPGVTCGRDENAARVLLRWLETRLAGESGSMLDASPGGCPRCGAVEVLPR